MPNQTNLKLLANNTNDLKVISAHLQDSILTTKNIANLKKNRLFLLEFNRFMWEDIEKDDEDFDQDSIDEEDDDLAILEALIAASMIQDTGK